MSQKSFLMKTPQCVPWALTSDKASSGKWFYITYSGGESSKPQGWFGSAEEAKQAFDAQHF
jgi:hypothetical protein